VSTAVQAQPGQRHIPLSSIIVEDGFNPRGAVIDDAEFQALVATIKDRGLLQPLRVRPVGDEFVIVAGERRYRAAVQASVMDVPVIIDKSDPEADGAATERLVDAVIENDIRVDLDRISRAQAYARMKKDGGLTIKGIAERVGRRGRTGQQHVREHLALLDLPEVLRPQLATGEIPMAAVRPLLKLHKAHAGLAELAVQRILAPANAQDLEDYDKATWRDVQERPFTLVSDHRDHLGGVLPIGVFAAHEPYRLSVFNLSAKAVKDLTALVKITGEAVEHAVVYFNDKSIVDAEALEAVVRDDYPTAPSLIVGQDVADELAAAVIAASLKRTREADKVRRQRQAEAKARRNAADKVGDDRDEAERDESVPETPEQVAAREAAAEAERVAENKRRSEALVAERAAAVAFNDELGAAVYNGLSRVRVDDRVLRILTAVPVATDLSALAMRGARYGLPGWVTETEVRGGTTKRIYLEKVPATAKAREYLAGAKTVGEIAGRTLALIAMATYANELAVAESYRWMAPVRATAMPWAGDVEALIDEVVAENLKGELLTAVLAERAEQREEAQAAARQAKELHEQLTEQLANIAELDEQQLADLPALLHSVPLNWLDRSNHDRTIAAEVRRRKDETAAAALAAVLAKIGDALALPDLSVEELAEFEVLAGESLTGNDLEAATAAITAERQRREAKASADPTARDDKEADQTS
jgi:ParB/RepB/Spo0J family partition protein